MKYDHAQLLISLDKQDGATVNATTVLRAGGTAATGRGSGIDGRRMQMAAARNLRG